MNCQFVLLYVVYYISDHLSVLWCVCVFGYRPMDLCDLS